MPNAGEETSTHIGAFTQMITSVFQRFLVHFETTLIPHISLQFLNKVLDLVHVTPPRFSYPSFDL